MTPFEEKLLRLKQLLAVASDGDVAAALGMSPAALSDRKRRESFPVDQLLALQARRPDLDVDIPYLLTGVRLPGAGRAQMEAMLRASTERNDVALLRLAENVIHEQGARAKGREEVYQRLLALADRADDRRLDLLIEVAAAFAGVHQVTSHSQPAATQKFEREVGMVTSGNATIHMGNMSVQDQRKTYVDPARKVPRKRG